MLTALETTALETTRRMGATGAYDLYMAGVGSSTKSCSGVLQSLARKGYVKRYKYVCETCGTTATGYRPTEQGRLFEL